MGTGFDQDLERPGPQGHTQLLPYAGQVFGSKVLPDQEYDGDAEADEEAPLEERVQRVEHALGSEQTPHERAGVERVAVVGACEAGRLIGCAEAGNIVQNEVLGADGDFPSRSVVILR